MSEPQLLIVGPKQRGRPTRAGVPSSRPVQFYMTPEEKTALKSVANLEGRKVADLVRSAVNEYVADFGERRVFKAGPFE